MSERTKNWLQIDDAARCCGVSCYEMRHWIQDGSLRAIKLPTGHIRVLARDVFRTLLEHGKPIPSQFCQSTGRKVIIIDADAESAGELAKYVEKASGSTVSVVTDAGIANDLFRNSWPDAVLIGMRFGLSGRPSKMLIISKTRGYEESGENVSLPINSILPFPVDKKLLFERLVEVLL